MYYLGVIERKNRKWYYLLNEIEECLGFSDASLKTSVLAFTKIKDLLWSLENLPYIPIYLSDISCFDNMIHLENIKIEYLRDTFSHILIAE